MFFRLLSIGCAALIAACGGAKAATTVYPVSTFQNSGVTQPNRLVGNTPATSARFTRGDSVGLNYATDVTKFTLNVEITQLRQRTTYLTVQFGRFVAGVFTPATGVGLSTPLGLPSSTTLYVAVTDLGTLWINTVAFETGCGTLGGCNAIRLGNSTLRQNGARFDVSNVGATPEPQVWALMILGFIGIAWRLKAARNSAPGFLAFEAEAAR